MCIVDQGQAEPSATMSIHREEGFASDLIGEAMAARAGHEIHRESFHRAWH